MRKFTLLLTLLVAMVTTAFAQTVVSNLADFKSDKCYTVTTTERGGWAVSNDKFCSTNDAGLGTSSDPTDANQQFAVLSNDGENYYLYSVGAKKFVKSDKSLIAGRGEAIELADASAVGAGRVRVNFKGIANTYINLGGSNQMTIDWWSAVDAGNAVQFLEVADFDPTEALAMLNNVATITYQFKYEGNVVATQEVIAVPGEAYPDYTLSAPYGVTGAAKPEGTVSGDETVTIELTITKALPFEAVAEGEPTKWYYAQIHGNHLSYMTNPGIGAEMPWKINGELITAIDEANADNYTWGFVGNLWTGFKMVSKAGGAIKSTGSGNVTIVESLDEATAFIAMAPATSNNAAAESGFCLLNAEAGQYINAQNVGVNHWTSNDAGSTIVVTEREITVEPETPFEVVAVTPTEAVAELTTVTVEFSEEIEGTFEIMAMSQIYLGTKGNGCSFEVNGKVLTITPFNAINTPGEYKLVIPEGLITRKSNGEAVTMNGEYVFTVKEAVVEPEPEEPAAGIEVGKHYRIKSTSNGDYLTIGDTNDNPYGHVHGAALDEANDNQVFTFIAVEGQENTYYVQSVAGKYFSYEGAGAGWNVNGTDDATKAHALTFEAAEGELQYLIKCYNASKSDYKYFKYEYVNASGKYHPFNDADLDKAEVWTLEEVAVVEPEPGEKDDNTIALIESAYELLEIEGIGTPAAAPREALEEAIEIAEEMPDTEAGTALQAAIDAYYAATEIVLPEAGKAYTFTAVWGEVEYYLYNNNGTLAVAERGEEELPVEAKFVCEYNADAEYKFQFKTADGKYYLAYPSIGGKDWLDNESVTGLETESSRVTMFNVNKILAGGAVAATNDALFGLVKMDGYRGYNNNKFIDEFGPIVVKHSAQVFDGASAPFYNENFTSAIRIEETVIPVEPLKVVAVTPAEDEVVNSLREITIEFDAEIAVKELSGTERINIQYLGISNVLIGTTATVEGNTLKLVADSEIKDSGKHTLVIPAGVVTRVSDGVAYEGGTFTFTVEKAAVVVEPLTVVAVTPAESVEKLETITIEFSDKVDVPATASGKFTIADADGNNVATLYAWDAEVDGKVVTLTLTEAITEAGEYTFSFAEGLVTRQGDGATCAYTCTINVTGVVGIDSIYDEAGDSVIYDITGRKIDKITEGGIYIVNGKKVLVK